MEAVALVKVNSDEDVIVTAFEHFLGKSHDEIEQVVQLALMGHLRGILGAMEV